MFRKGIIAAAILGLGVSVTGAAWGQEAAAETSELDAIIVSADRVPTVAREVSQNVIVIGEEEIQKSAANSVADLLKQKGIQVYYDGAEGYGNEGVVMRGGRSSMHGFDVAGDILVLVDGHRTGADTMSQLELNSASRIEVINGPGAVQYGAAAMGGVINIITKRGGEQTRAGLESGFGSFGEYRAKGYVSGQYNQLDYSFGASYLTRNDYNIGGNGLRLGDKGTSYNSKHYENSDLRHRTRYSANLGWNFLENRHRLGLAVSGSNTVDAGKGEDFSMNDYTRDAFQTRQDRSNYNLDLSYEGRTEDESKGWMARYFRGETGYDLNRLVDGLDSDRLPYSENENKYQGAQAQFSWELDRFQFVTGLDWMSYDFTQDQTGAASSATTQSTALSTFDNIGGFFLGKLHLLENRNLTLSAGVRYDTFDVSVDARSYRATDNPDPMSTDQSRSTWTPSVGLSYSPFDFLKLRANYAQAFKMPTPKQLTGYTVMSMTPFIGNPDLEPETSDNWDIGFDVDYQALSFSATYFASKYKDMVTYRWYGANTGPRPDVDFNYYWYFNQDEAKINGVELGASFDVGEHFDLGFTLEPYLYWTHLLKFEDGNGFKLANRSRNTLSTGVKFDYEPWGLIVNLDATYYGTQYNPSGETVNKDNPNVSYNGYAFLDVGHATIWDLSLSKRLYTFDDFGEMKVKAAVKNIFDKRYATDAAGYMPGATAYIGLAWDY